MTRTFKVAIKGTFWEKYDKDIFLLFNFEIILFSIFIIIDFLSKLY